MKPGEPLPSPEAAARGVETMFSIPLDFRRWWTIIPELVAVAATGALPLLVALNVTGRYTGWYRVPWVDDIVKVLFQWIIFVGGALAVKYQAHVRMGMVADRLAARWRPGRAWLVGIRLSPIVMGLILLVLGIPIVGIHMTRQLTWLQIPSGYFSTVIPASGALMIYYTIMNLLRPAADDRVGISVPDRGVGGDPPTDQGER